MKKKFLYTSVAAVALMSSAAFAQSESFCSNSSHSGQSVKISSNQVGKIGNIGYELWDENGHGGSATFYDDGSMDCTISSAKDYLCRAGLSLGSDKTYDQLGGDMIAEFKLVKQSGNNVGYSYIGVYGWMEGVSGSPSGLVEYYVIDNTLANDMPGSWIGNENKGTIQVDGGTYTVYRNTRTGPAIKSSGNATFYQYFSVRTSPRDCGTINISEHMRQWEKKGMTMGKLYEAKVLGEAGNVNGEVQNGHMDFPHAKVYIGDGSSSGNTSGGSTNTDAGNTNVNQGGADQGGAQGGMDWGNMDFGNMDWGNMGGDGNTGDMGNMDWGNMDFGNMDWGNMDFGNMDWGNMGGDGNTGDMGNMDWGNMDWGNMDFGNMDFGNMDWGNMGGDGNTGFDWGNMGGNTDTGDNGGNTNPAIDAGNNGNFSWGDVGGNTDAGKTDAGKTDAGNTDNGGTGTFTPTTPGDIYAALPSEMKFNSASKTYRIFNTQGRYLGNIELQTGSSLSEAIFSKFGKAGIYMVKNGSKAMTVKVTH